MEEKSWKVKMFTVICTNDKIWNINELYTFLIENQHTNIQLVLQPEAACLTHLGLYDILDRFTFKEVEIFTENLLEKHSKYKISINNPCRFFYIAPTVPSENHIWNKNKIFMCLYGRPTAVRLGIISYINKYYKNIAHLSCQGNIDTEDSRLLFELEKLFGYRAESIIEFSELIPKLPIVFDTRTTYSNIEYNYADVTASYYKDILIDIVSETFNEGNSFFVTEKTARAILMKKPFIIIGTINFLRRLRQMGFKTFYEFWDESYDGELPKDRFKKILNIIDDLSCKSKEELFNIYLRMQPILEHNYNLLISKNFDTSFPPLEP